MHKFITISLIAIMVNITHIKASGALPDAFLSANSLQKMCSDPNMTDECLAYIAGVLDMASFASMGDNSSVRSLCLHDDVRLNEISEDVLKFIDDKKSLAHIMSGAMAVYTTLGKDVSCLCSNESGNFVLCSQP